MGSRRGTSSRKSVVPGIVRTKADAPLKTSRKQRRTLKHSSCGSKISCAKAEITSKETTNPIQSAEVEESLAQEASPAKNSNQYSHVVSPHKSSSEGSVYALDSDSTKNCAMASGQTSLSPVKLKLQLFPVNEFTRKGLEKDGFNPHLELTLGSRKKISSVLKHLNIKWGSSSIAVGEIMLFSYNNQQWNSGTSERWTSKNTDVLAGDVYLAIGCPSIFRLRYGWVSSPENMSSQAPPFIPPSNTDCPKLEDSQLACRNIEDMEAEKQSHQDDMPVSRVTSSDTTISTSIPLDQAVGMVQGDSGNGEKNLSSALWVDDLTNISFGDLLKETSSNPGGSGCDVLPVDKYSCLSQTPACSDSFDAAIAEIVCRQQVASSSTPAFHASFLDGDNTCHSFPFQNIAALRNEAVASSPNPNHNMRGQPCETDPLKSLKLIDTDHYCQQPKHDTLPEEQGDDNPHVAFSDINWNDSLGPLDVSLPSSKQIIGEDNISLSNLLANSMDAFQNCSFFK